MYKIIKRSQAYLLLCIALFIHLLFLDHATVMNAKPDLMLLLVIFFALFFGEKAGFEFGLVAGLLKDLFAFDIFPINAFTHAATGLIVGILNTKFFKESKATQVTLVLIFSVFAMALHFILNSLCAAPSGMTLFGYIMNFAVPSGLFTALVSIPIFSKLIEVYGLREKSDFL